MKLSIITINYNNKAGLQRTIDSVISQTWKDFEWLVIDGGSTDGSRDLIEQHQDEMAYWCSEPDRGIYHAMNKGLAKARGEYCLFLNSGDELFSNEVISCVLPHLDGTDFLIGNIYLATDRCHNLVKSGWFTGEGVIRVLNQFSFPHQSTFIKREVFERYGYYREDMRISSDWWLTYQALIIGTATIKYIPCDISIYDTTGISSTNSQLMYNERESLLKERPYLYQMYRFYNENIDIIKSIRSSKFTFFIYRFFYKIYRLVV